MNLLIKLQSMHRYDMITKYVIDECLDVGSGDCTLYHNRCDIKDGTDIHELPYNDNEFTTVVCLQVLEHVTDPIQALRELKRVAKKRVVITIPREPEFSFIRYLLGLGWHPEHLWAITPQAINNVMGEPIINKVFNFRRWLLVYDI